MLMFESLAGKRWRYVNLDDCFRRSIREGVIGPVPRGCKSPMLVASSAEAFLDRLHCDLSINASYGGWLEDRSMLWRGSYLEADKKFIHLAVDFNVPPGTIVSLPFAGTILRVDDDSPELHGWGPRVFVLHEAKKHVFVFAHLEPPQWKAGVKLQAGASFARIGESAVNGQWYPHLHVQAMTLAAYERHKEEGFKNLDGYCSKEDLPQALLDFTDPLPILCRF